MTDVTETRRWRGVVAIPLAAGAVALVADRPSLLLVGGVGVVFALYARMAWVPEPRLELERRVSELRPGAGEAVTVTVSVTNVGRPLPDLRVVDGVPPALAVVEGSPRCGAVLRSGETVTFSYTLETRPGRHCFEPATVVARDLSGALEVERTVSAETELACASDASDATLRAMTTEFVGRVLSDAGGSGVEFDRTRRYRRGDALSHVDWKGYARTGTRTTVEYRREQSATVVVLVDAREAAYRAAGEEPHAVACSVAAAEELAVTLGERRNRVGVAGFGDEFCWLAPGAGRDHLAEVRRLLTSHRTFSAHPPEAEPSLAEQCGELRTRLPADAQVVLLSPLCDAAIERTARRLDASGNAVSVLSPDPTSSATLGQRLAAVERENAVCALRRAGIPVVEWSPGTPVASAFARAPEVSR